MKNHLLKFFTILITIMPGYVNTLSQGSCTVGQSDTYWHIHADYGSKRLANAHTSYFCHDFVRMYFESSSCPTKPTWYYPIVPNCWCSLSQAVVGSERYYDTNRYIQVSNEARANIVRIRKYFVDHSQVKDVIVGGTQKYISKYDYSGPLVGHELDNSFYTIEYPSFDFDHSYYFYLGPIVGNSNISSTNPVSFSVNYSSGVNYTWSRDPQYSSIISISPGSSPNTVNVTALQSGTAVLKLVAQDVNSKTQEITLNISLSTPLITGTYDNAGNYYQTLNTVNNVSVGSVYVRVSCQGATTFIWQKTSGNINGYFPPGSTASFSMTSGGSITFLLTAKNGSTTIASKSITFYNGY